MIKYVVFYHTAEKFPDDNGRYAPVTAHKVDAEKLEDAIIKIRELRPDVTIISAEEYHE